ncbi:MAG: RDD family protein [Streptococcaceae bacterium]|nr:RDD family protein [Streptococcaceae bacterium]
MRSLLFVQRGLSSLIDLIVVYLPCLFLASIVFKSNASFASLSSAVMFCIYNVVAVSNFEGRTIGKYFARLKVQTPSPNFLDVGQREFAKLLYFLPFMVGLVILSISCIMYALSGKFLHDWIGKSQVVVYGKS